MRLIRSATLLLIMGMLSLSAQEFRATISGRVLDASGAAIPGATVQAVNVATNETTTGSSGTTGAFTVPFLRPGEYKLTVTAQGFKQYVRENITLQVGQIAGIDVTLEIGAVTENITVTAEAALLETQTASRVGIVNQKQVSELPLNSRNPFMLGAMMSGVTFRGAAIWQRPFDNGAIAEWSVNGGRQSNNEFLMDGAPNNGQAGGNNIAYVPIVDAVQEFSVQQNSYDAQYGKTGGGVFNVMLKSGTNQHRITLWEFYRNKIFDANTFQNNSLGRNADGTERAPRPDHVLHQYGWQFDGPVHLPKWLPKDGPVKLFYLGSYEGYYEKWPQFLRNSYPEMDMRRGDFSKMTAANGQPVTIYNPFTTRFAANGDPIRDPFAGNIIPSSMHNPVALNVTKYMPEPNAVTAGVGYARQNRLNPQYAAVDDFYNLILKFDWNFGDKHRSYIRHASNDRTEDRCVNDICAGPGQDGQQPFQRINDAYVLDWVSTLSPTFVLNVRGSYNRFIEKGFGRANEGFDLKSLGLPSSLVSSIPGPAYFGRWEMGGYSSLGRGQGVNITNNYNLMANATKIRGNHTMKFGMDLRRIHYIRQNSGNILFFRSDANWTQRLWNQGEATAGDSYASFLLGLQSSNANVFYPVYPFNRQWYFSPYFQDDWKLTRKLTMNVGLRWDYNGPPDEKYNRLNRGFNPAATNPAASQIPADMLAMYPQLRNLKGGLEFAGVNGNPRAASKRVFSNWQPRIGLAYALNSKTVLRGGYGLYFMNPNNDYLREAGYQINTPIVESLDDGRTPVANLLSNPYPSGILTPGGSSLGYGTFLGQNTNWFNPNFDTPFVHQFSFGVQYQVNKNSTFDISYVGSRTKGANNEQAFNIPSASFRKQCNLLEGGDPNFCNAAVTNPFRNVAAFRGTSFFTAASLSRYQLNRPFPQFSGDMIQQGLGTSDIFYNSLQLNYNMRVGRDLTLLGNYTFSKMIERWGYSDPFNNVLQSGLYFNDWPHYLKFNTVYEMPFGKGKKFGAGAGRGLNMLIGGWQFSTYTQVGSGEPNNLPGNAIMLKDPRTSGGDWNGSVNWNAHQIVGWNPCVLRQFNDGRVVPQQFSINRGCGTDPANYAWLMVADYAPGGGNTPSNSRMSPFRSGQIRKQMLFNVDASLAKTVQITERLRFQFRLEAFNLTNYNFFGRDNNFNTNPNDPNFGTQFPSQAWIGNGYPRQVQLGFKIFW